MPSPPAAMQAGALAQLMPESTSWNYISAAADTVADALEAIHAQLLGRADHCFAAYPIPGFDPVLGGRPVTDHALAHAPPHFQLLQHR